LVWGAYWTPGSALDYGTFELFNVSLFSRLINGEASVSVSHYENYIDNDGVTDNWGGYIYIEDLSNADADDWSNSGIGLLNAVQGRQITKGDQPFTFTNALGYPFIMTPKEFGVAAIYNFLGDVTASEWIRVEITWGGKAMYLYYFNRSITASASPEYTVKFPN